MFFHKKLDVNMVIWGGGELSNIRYSLDFLLDELVLLKSGPFAPVCR